MKGEEKIYSWKNEVPKCDLPDPIVSMINMKDKYRPFNIYPTGSKVKTFPGNSKLSHFHWWNHFPVSQITSDGRSAVAPDRASHSSLVWGIPSKDFLMYGLTDKGIKSLVPLAKSWNNAPAIKEIKGCSGLKYVQEERAYDLTAGSTDIVFEIRAGTEAPLVHPAFVIVNWNDEKVELKINDKSISNGKDFRSGFIHTAEGINLVVWLNKTYSGKTLFEFSTK